MTIPAVRGPYVAVTPPTKADGAEAAVSGSGFTLEENETYYVELGVGEVSVASVHLLLAAALVITSIEFEDSNFADVELVSATAGEWVKEDPESADVALVGAGMSVDGLTIAKTAGDPGAALVHLGNVGSRRMRLKIVVGGAGGVIRIAPHGKL